MAPAPAPARRRRTGAGAEELARQAVEAERRLDDLQERLGLRFKRRELLREAMTHTSWINERGDQGRDNERLEYLGDAVLELVAGEYLFSRFPNYDEGQLTQMRSSLVSTVALARLGEQLLLGETLRLGRGAAKSGARRLTSLHANAFEALVGAIFLDQGYRKAGKVFLSRIGDLSAWTDPNFKGRLQALAQERYGAPPQYQTAPAPGDPRSRVYMSQVSVEGHGQLGEGRGGTKQAAEQAAARAAIDLLVAPVSKKRRRRSPAAEAAPAPTALWAPSAPTTAGQLEPAAAAPAVPGGAEVVAGPAADVATEPQAPEAPSGKRRRRRSSRSRVATNDAGTVAAEAPEPTPAVVLAETPTAPEVGDGAPAKRRRRRPSHGRTEAAEPAGTPAGTGELAAEPPPLRPDELALAADGVPAKRRRRRSTRGRTPTGEAEDIRNQSALAEVGSLPETVPPPSGDPEPAKRRRHRSGRSRSATAPLGETPTLAEFPARDSVAPFPEGGPAQAHGPSDQARAEAAHLESGPSPAAAEAVSVAGPDGAPVRRTHRGRRGGRRRPGGTVTPAP
ncbi:MAG: ribonuclease III [Candidatus Dormibacteraeota bacterium]|nr:ribonuclease III [Candidatus Dormibacteraeota bacterium]